RKSGTARTRSHRRPSGTPVPSPTLPRSAPAKIARRPATTCDRSPARRAAVISTPDLGVFAVSAAGSGLRRGHVIYSGVFAVAAVWGAVASCSCPSFGLLDDFG